MVSKTMREKQPPPNVFDDSLAKEFTGKSLLIGITHADSAGNIVRRSQVFGTVIKPSGAKSFHEKAD